MTAKIGANPPTVKIDPATALTELAVSFVRSFVMSVIRADVFDVEIVGSIKGDSIEPLDAWRDIA